MLFNIDDSQISGIVMVVISTFVDAIGLGIWTLSINERMSSITSCVNHLNMGGDILEDFESQ